MDKLEPLWSRSPATQSSCVTRVSEILTVKTSHRKKPLLFYFNILKCASPMVLLEFQCPTTQVRNVLGLFFDAATSLSLSLSSCRSPSFSLCRRPAVRGELPQPAPDAGQSQAGQQGRPRVLQAVLQGGCGLCQTGECSEILSWIISATLWGGSVLLTGCFTWFRVLRSC